MPSESDLVAIQSLLDRYLHYWGKHDMPAWGALFTDDADFVTHAGIWWRSREQNIVGHEAVSQFVIQQKLRYTLRLADVRLMGADVALVHANWSWPQFARSPGDIPEDVGGILTMILLRQDDEWRIRASHNTKTQSSTWLGSAS